VAIVDKEVEASFGTSKANSGIIHAGFHDAPGSLKARLCVEGNGAFERLAGDLGVPFERRGELVIAFTEEEVQALQGLYARGQENGVPDMVLLGRERTLELEPNVNPDILGSLHAPTAGIIGPYEYCFALVENAARNGVALVFGNAVQAVVATGSRGFTVETSDGATLATRYVVNAAGLYADEIANMVGLDDFRIRPRKGEEYLLDKRVGGLIHRVIFPVPSKRSKGLLVIPTIDGPVMVGPTSERTRDKEDFSTTRKGLRKVFRHAQKMVPSIRSSDVITSFAGVRPVSSTGDFVIGPTSVRGFVNAAGIQSPGLTASPAIARMVVEALRSTGLEMDAREGFVAQREPIPRIRDLVERREFAEVARLVERDPSYGRMICRCENITEAEVQQAVRRGHVTLDGVKYATRAGTGRCQGGFCTFRIMGVISRETGMALEQVTKKGPGTEVVLGSLDKGGEGARV
jgi:glycerol-3-phosphate dehydrogenase